MNKELLDFVEFLKEDCTHPAAARYIDDMYEEFKIHYGKCECYDNKEILTHKIEYDAYPYGDNIEYDLCPKCGLRWNLKCF